MARSAGFFFVNSRWGGMLGVVSGGCLEGLFFLGQKTQPSLHILVSKGYREDGEHPLAALVKTQIGDYESGQRRIFDIPLCPSGGTPFVQKVWSILLEIPLGKTVTYEEIARQAGSPRAARAVGSALGRNPHSIIRPCHRVIGANGALTGYAGGVSRKAELLRFEAALVSPARGT